MLVGWDVFCLNLDRERCFQSFAGLGLQEPSLRFAIRNRKLRQDTLAQLQVERATPCDFDSVL